MADIFLSYAREDGERAAAIARALAARGWSVWWDRSIPHGSDFNAVIQQQLNAARCILVLWSRAGLESKFVRDEASEGLNGRLLPVLIEGVQQPLGFRQLQAADLTDWNGASAHAEWDRLVGSIASIVPPPSAAAAQTSASVGVPQFTVPPRRLGSLRRQLIAGVTVLGLLIAALVGWYWSTRETPGATSGTRLSVEELESRLDAANISLSTGAKEDVERVRAYVRDPEAPYRALGEASLEVLKGRRLRDRSFLDMIDKWYTKGTVGRYLTSDGRIRMEVLPGAIVQAHNDYYTRAAKSLEDIVE
jgi:hypothetical protein